METLSVRYEDAFIHDMEKIMEENRYATKAEFIREAIRDKMNDLETKAALRRLQAAYGAGKKKGRKITKKDIDKAGEEAFKELAQSLNVDLE
jgi:Arc/MetJ-type ribon-helix-helix transcriptional regulator